MTQLKKRKKSTPHDRAHRFANKTFLIEKFVESGDAIVITPKMREHIRNYMSYAWMNGYTAGRRSTK